MSFDGILDLTAVVFHIIKNSFILPHPFLLCLLWPPSTSCVYWGVVPGSKEEKVVTARLAPKQFSISEEKCVEYRGPETSLFPP